MWDPHHFAIPSRLTDFLIDINGYFAPDDGQTGLSYYPVSQCTASDSSDPVYPTPFGQPTYSGGSRSIPVPKSSFCAAIPTAEKGYAVNLSANTNGGVLSYVTLYPTGQLQPNASMLNDFQGKLVTNSAIVPAGNNGSIDIYASEQTDLKLMIGGYFFR